MGGMSPADVPEARRRGGYIKRMALKVALFSLAHRRAVGRVALQSCPPQVVAAIMELARDSLCELIGI